jgi:hypothetical protein
MNRVLFPFCSLEGMEPAPYMGGTALSHCWRYALRVSPRVLRARVMRSSYLRNVKRICPVWTSLAPLFQ